WERRTTLTDDDGAVYELMALPDLVLAKKTQRSKDWPMLQRLVEAHYAQHRATATNEQRRFWLRELRTPEFLVELTETTPPLARELCTTRPLLALAIAGEVSELLGALIKEERDEREWDRAYWAPLKMELEQLRRGRARK